MKSLLVLSFIALFAYLILYICGFLDQVRLRKKKSESFVPTHNLVSVVDRLMYLTDHQLMLLKDDLYAIRSCLDKPVSLPTSRIPGVKKPDYRDIVNPASWNITKTRLNKRHDDRQKMIEMVDHVVRYQLVIIQAVLMIMVGILVWI